MGYEFTGGPPRSGNPIGQYISYGTHDELYQAFGCSIGFWINFPSALPTQDGERITGVSASFPPLLCLADTANVSGGNGYGVTCEHVKGGSFSFGVNCVPGLVETRYKLNSDTWRYFGFSRDDTTRTYTSYFGSKRALVDGPTATYLPGQEPYPESQPGQVNGPFFVGMSYGSLIGPFSYYAAVLSKSDHLQVAQCRVPSGLAPFLRARSKMLEGAIDISSYAWANSFFEDPTYVPDDGCASFAAGDDYRLYNG